MSPSIKTANFLSISFSAILTLPLSGRQGACGGVAEIWWWSVHSRGLLSVLLCRDTPLQCFLSERVEALPLHLRSQRELLVQFRRNSKIELA